MWVKLDDNAAEHPKVQALSGDALRLWLRGLCYCARHLTDGDIPRAKAAGWAFEISMATESSWESLVSELLSAPDGFEHGLWEESGDGYRVHDYLVYNPTRDQAETRREKAAERMRRLRALRSREHDEERSREQEESRSDDRDADGSGAPSPSPSPSPSEFPSGEDPPNPPQAGGRRVPAEWARKAAKNQAVTAAQLEASVVRCLREIRQDVIRADRAGTAAAPLLKLWRALGKPQLAWWADRVCLVARAAQMSGHKLFARDIRAEDWEEGTDRTHAVATIAVQSRWDERLAAAEDWASKTQRGDDVAVTFRRRWMKRGDPDSWEPLEAPVPLVTIYLEIARELVAGDPDALKELERIEESGFLTSEAATSVVQVALAAKGRW